MRKSAAHFGIPWPRYRLIGVAELAAAAGILIGLWWHPLGVAAAAGMALLLLGAIIAHRKAADSVKEMAPAGWPSSSPWPTWPSRSWLSPHSSTQYTSAGMPVTKAPTST